MFVRWARGHRILSPRATFIQLSKQRTEARHCLGQKYPSAKIEIQNTSAENNLGNKIPLSTGQRPAYYSIRLQGSGYSCNISIRSRQAARASLKSRAKTILAIPASILREMEEATSAADEIQRFDQGRR